MKMTTETRYGFGPHMMLDCYGCPREKLSDLDLIYKLLDELPAGIGLTKVMSPHVFRYSGRVPEDWGVSGVVLIAESHISVHTFPDKGHAFIDIFSCKDFDTDSARRQLLEAFGATDHEVVLVNRGLEFPRNARRTPVPANRERPRIFH